MTMAVIQVDVERLRELTEENLQLCITSRRLREENLQLLSRITVLEQRVKELSLEWVADPTIREKRELLPPDDGEGSDI